MRRPGTNLTVGFLLFILAFGISAPALWGAAQLVKTDEPEEVVDGGGGGGTPGGPVDLTIGAENIMFDLNRIVAATGVEVTITQDNQDAGVPHNVAFYTDRSASTSIFVSELITGPATDTFTFPAPSTPGDYFFRCDVHPDQMTGVFEVVP